MKMTVCYFWAYTRLQEKNDRGGGQREASVGGDVLVWRWRQDLGGMGSLVGALCGGWNVSIACEMITDLISSLCYDLRDDSTLQQVFAVTS